ncbi:MAG: adenosylcobinamide-GDP ribazoletransferase [Candidatus Aureabacteria bacterium]|nr:adenosylcobinamide-GDP ribazoletransferase [Candidatus Auribacterota bacterium]
MKYFLLALQFLTILPVRLTGRIKDEDVARSLLTFPLVGLCIGSILAAFASVFSFLPASVVAALILILSAWFTGGLHLDGFADSCDGLYGQFSQQKRLANMKDSHIGAMGAIGLICLLLLKFSLISNISYKVLWKALIMMGIFSRWTQVCSCYSTKYLREKGTAKQFIDGTRLKHVIVGALFVLTIFLLLVQVKGVYIFFLSCIAVIAFAGFIRKRLGGMTGDTIGAVNEIAEVSCLFFTLIILEI